MSVWVADTRLLTDTRLARLATKMNLSIDEAAGVLFRFLCWFCDAQGLKMNIVAPRDLSDLETLLNRPGLREALIDAGFVTESAVRVTVVGEQRMYGLHGYEFLKAVMRREQAGMNVEEKALLRRIRSESRKAHNLERSAAGRRSRLAFREQTEKAAAERERVNKLFGDRVNPSLQEPGWQQEILYALSLVGVEGVDAKRIYEDIGEHPDALASLRVLIAACSERMGSIAHPTGYIRGALRNLGFNTVLK